MVFLKRGDSGDHSLAQLFGFTDLVPLSVSSVGPLFSVAATGGVMAAQAGWWTLPAICILAVPFIVSSFVFRLMNRHFPNSGASYHWSAKVVGKRVSRYQAWILILAYFMSIPPIAIPAGSYTLALIAPHMRATPLDQTLATLFWVLFAAAPLLLGAKPTATITKIFFVIEMLSLGLLVIAGVVDYSSISVPIHFGTIPLGGMLVVAVVAATILDGWEIDSYAAEESKRPRVDPGKAGIVGAILAFCFYLTLYPLMFSETPISKLANSSDPLAVWGMRLFPHSPAVVLIPVIASTAGGLWLTTFILTRVIFAMGRENIVPSVFSRLSTRKVPHVATVTILIATMLVCSIQLFFHSISSFFGLVLSTAGFFLLAEFFLDSVVASIFLISGHKKHPEVSLNSHRHRILTAGSIFSSVTMGSLLITFFIFGPKAIGAGIDQILIVMLIFGFGFAFLVGKKAKNLFIFHGNDVEPLKPIEVA